MSSRALRKLQNDEELLESLLSSAGDARTIPETTTNPPAQKVNMFALINDNTTDSDEGHQSEDHANDSVESGEEDAQKQEHKTDNVVLLTRSQKRSRQKKNKKKNNQTKTTKQKKSVQESEKEEINDEDDLDKIIQQFRRKDILKYGVETGGHSNDYSDNEDEEFQTASETEDYHSEYKSETTIKNDLRTDNAFSEFSPKYLKGSARFFNTDIKKLDPHSEFKMLFDDLTSESLEDIDSMTSTAISPQQLKQIQRMKRLLRNWGGKDHRSVPNGPGSSAHRLQFTKIREDWLPTPRGELSMQSISFEDLTDWQLWQRPSDWKDVVEQDLQEWKKLVSFYKFEPLNLELNKKAMTEFYLSVVLHPDHEALIHLIQSKFPYHVPGLLQVALIMVRQGDRSNTNGLIQRALFVFDRALRNGVQFDALSCQLPYIYFFNRQFYLAIFRYILTLAQRGAVATAGEWCKTLWSLSPLEDPLGCRYFIDHYLLLNNEYQYLIELSKSPLTNCYKQWYTLGISLGTVLSYLRIGDADAARQELLKTFRHHPLSVAELYTKKLLGDETLIRGLEIKGQHAEILETQAYISRFPMIWKNAEDLNFLNNELTNILQTFQEKSMSLEIDKPSLAEEALHPFFIENIPINLLRFSILSEESSVMASIPANIWSDYEVYEFDVLPPTPTTKDSIDVLETVKSFVNDRELATSQMNLMQDEDLLNQIRQMSLEQYLHENPNAAPE